MSPSRERSGHRRARVSFTDRDQVLLLCQALPALGGIWQVGTWQRHRPFQYRADHVTFGLKTLRSFGKASCRRPHLSSVWMSSSQSWNMRSSSQQ